MVNVTWLQLQECGNQGCRIVKDVDVEQCPCWMWSRVKESTHLQSLTLIVESESCGILGEGWGTLGQVRVGWMEIGWGGVRAGNRVGLCRLG